MIDLEGLEKLIAEATDTPWRKGIEDGAIYATEIDDDRGWSIVVAEKVCEANAALIVAAVNALPELIAMARRVEGLDYLRPEVQAFARRMEDALRRKDSERGGNSWQKQTLAEEILPHLQERADRIHHYLKQASKYRQRSDEFMEQMETDNAAEQAVHAANFAMMLADICVPLARTALKEKPQ